MLTTGERLDALITDNDKTKPEVADALQISRMQLYKWRNDKAEMTIDKLRAICEYFQVSADYLLGLPPDLNWPRIEKN